MREIKFRGYNAKNKTWIVGCYILNRGAHFVCPDEFADGKSWDDYEVDPETVGQFTGMGDKNGKKIYEGDVFEIESRGEKVRYKVMYNGCTWCGERVGDFYNKRHVFYLLLYCHLDEITVIGNEFEIKT